MIRRSIDYTAAAPDVARALIGASLFVGVAIGLGRVFHSAVDSVLGMLAGFGQVGIVGIVAALLLFIAFRFAQRYWLIRALRMTRISVAELERLRASDTPHAIYDVRAAASRERDGAIPGARPWAVEATELPAEATSPEVEVIVYCDCPNDYSAAKVAYRLRHAGFTNVRPLHGGIDAWTQNREIVVPVHAFVIGGEPRDDADALRAEHVDFLAQFVFFGGV